MAQFNSNILIAVVVGIIIAIRLIAIVIDNVKFAACKIAD